MSNEAPSTPVESMSGADFDFPYAAPYDIQLRLMRALYTCMERRQVGIFESPTGTGKSLSILCATLTWLRRHEEGERERLDAGVKLLEEQIATLSLDGDWVSAHRKTIALRVECDELKSRRNALNQVQATVDRIRSGKTNAGSRFGGKRSAVDTEALEDAEFRASLKGDKDEDYDEFAPGAFLDDAAPPPPPVDAAERPTVQQIFYVSRTHSQIAQFLRELQRCRSFAKSVRVTTVGSRASLCVNDAVRALGNSGLINDRCMNMQQCSSSSKGKASKVEVEDCHKKPCGKENKTTRKSKSSTTSACPHHKHEAEEKLGENMLTKVRDLDSVLRLARTFDACPYYATRHTTLPMAQLVLAPYQILLHESARTAWNIHLKDAVVIVDEAHNLFEAIAQMHQATLSVTQLDAVQRHLTLYTKKYGSRLSGANLMYVRQLASLVDRLLRVLRASTASNVMTLPEFIKSTSLMDVNVFKLVHYLEGTQLCRKLFGFACRHGNDPIDAPPPTPKLTGVERLLAKKAAANIIQSAPTPPKSSQSTHPSSIYQLKSFLDALCSPDDDGRIMTCVDDRSSSYRFLLLNAASRFEPVVRDARSVLLLGGTMSPSNILIDALRRDCGVASERLTQFSCGHVIQRDRLLPLVLCRSMTGQRMDFTYAHRSTDATLTALGGVLARLATTVTGGVVVFCSSYEYMHGVVRRWKEKGELRRITAHTELFTEPRSTDAVTTDSVLRDYAACIARTGRAMLLAVVGGKMSEGINFGDELGRCVVMVGLPYANKESADLKEKMKYLTQHTGQSAAGSEYYEAMCMSAVNQCIGRVIRHQNDYASIVLLDHRYANERIHGKLAGWIRDWVTVLDGDDAGERMIGDMKVFYAKHSK